MDGVYYDWSSSTYRSTDNNSSVIPWSYVSDLTSNYAGSWDFTFQGKGSLKADRSIVANLNGELNVFRYWQVGGAVAPAMGNSGSSELSIRQVLRNIESFTPVAGSLEINVGTEAGAAASTSPAGVFIPLQGRDKYKVRGFTSVGMGAGALGVGATLNSISYFYTGDIEHFDLRTFEGRSDDFDLTLGEGIIGGIVFTIAKNPRYNNEYLIGIGGVIGFGAGSPISGSYTGQRTRLW